MPRAIGAWAALFKKKNTGKVEIGACNAAGREKNRRLFFPLKGDSSHNTNQFTPARDIDYSWFIPHMVAADIKQTLSNL